MSNIQSYHFIGIGGIGMSSLAHICLDQGFLVSGSDIHLNKYMDALESRGACISPEQNGSLISKEKCVVFSTAINENHQEYLKAKEEGCALMHRSDLLKEMSLKKKSIVITGTHGKTSSTALLSHVLFKNEHDPSYMVGGKVCGFDQYGKFGNGEYFVLEGDESDGSFEKYDPYMSLITNLEFEHIDHYESLNHLIDIFQKFIQKVPEKSLVWCYDDENLKKMSLDGLSYGKSEKSDVYYKSFVQKDWTLRFEIYFHGESQGELELPLVGEHYAQNATGVYALCRNMGLKHSEIASAFKTFKGVCRRLEVLGDIHSVTCIDDYAHHPTEVEATLKGLSKVDPEKRVLAIFQPHRSSRFETFYHEFTQSFLYADKVIVTDIFTAGEDYKSKYSIPQFVKDVEKFSQVKCIYISRKSLLEGVLDHVCPHDMLITLGAGDITTLSHEVYSEIQNNGLKHKWNVGVLFGGPSPEHYVSVESAKALIPHFDESIYKVKEFYISPEGYWDLGNKQGITGLAIEALLGCDIIYPILHGFWGEDGAAQGLFSSLERPYVGCDYRASSICMDKIATKLIAKKWGVEITPFFPIEESLWKEKSERIISEIEAELSYPLYVKPSHLGSSIGIQKVYDRKNLCLAVNEALSFDTHALVEIEIKGRQLEFALYGSASVHSFPAGEIVSNGEFVEYRGKYGSKALPIEPLARVSKEIMEKGQELAKHVYRSIGIKGLARIDFFLTDEGTFILNEINPLPGFTPTSMYPLICMEQGMAFKDLIHRLLIGACYNQRMREKKISDIGDDGVIQ